ncbi:hypothetical protein HELRODRAFT_189038 [Helobdella robusta]|uniref:Uncharacterized protein n=1 Tax=Helobdella robusta TaxID=6412 RepID=T1FQK9_HELRO|nr:hypothetical protein HELRODRAFT_189038 [Helobdella robusta]ESN99224.1 hypothetical protein HELRODRAFT_189038 [Helobdella robusta]
MAQSVQTKYLTCKISKIKWQPVRSHLEEQPNIFVTGGYDELSRNPIAVWLVPNEAQSYESKDEAFDLEPQMLSSADLTGGVTDLTFMNETSILSSSSNGDINILHFNEDYQKLDLKHTYSKVHYYAGKVGCPCTSVCFNEDSSIIASAGEDGCINAIKNAGTQNAVTRIAVDNVTINGISFVDQSTVGTINLVGHLNLYDIRSCNKSSSKKFAVTGNLMSLLCMDQHPSQPHIVCAGGSDGQLFVWDLRSDGAPIAIHKGHSANMLDVKFHPQMPNNLFTCSQDGTLWHWQSCESPNSFHLDNYFKEFAGNNISNISSWLLDGEKSSRKIVSNLLPDNMFPINTLDVSHNRLICGLDSEQLYLFSNLAVR